MSHNKIKLKPHQIIPVNFIKNNYGLILFHSTGSGKTITSLSAMYQFNKDIIIIGPKASQKAFTDEIKKLKYNINKFTIYTYQKIKNIINSDLNIFKDKCVIIDEAHHLRSQTKNNILLTSSLFLSYKVILLTATPVVNYLNDISPLINIVKKDEVLPTDRELFNFLYFDENNLDITNDHLLYDKLKNCISYYKKDDSKDYPRSRIISKKIKMSKLQLDEYIKYIKKLIYQELDYSVNILDIDFSVLSKRKKNVFLNATRQLSNTMDGSSETPKMKEMLNVIKKNAFPAIVYSNYKKNGIYALAKLLNENNITLKTITGTTGLNKIYMIVNDYNNRKFDVLLLTSAGSESLDLKNTRQIHIMEPHWNEAKIKQVIGRAIRYKSHSSLLEKDRSVNIYRWISIFSKPYYNLSADEYLLQISKRKEQIFNAFKDILIKVAIEEYVDKKGGYRYKYFKYMEKYLNLLR